MKNLITKLLGRKFFAVMAALILVAAGACSSNSIVEQPTNPGSHSGGYIQPFIPEDGYEIDGYWGDPSCADLASPGESVYEFKVSYPSSTGYTDGFFAVDITVDGKEFDWASNVGVDFVIVKPVESYAFNLFVYDPPTEMTQDENLHAPYCSCEYCDIKEVLFCFDIDGLVSIDVEKGGPEKSAMGEIVTYSFKITNDGEIPLTLVSIDDSILNDLVIPEDCNELLPGESCEFEADHTVSELDSDPLVNTVDIVYSGNMPPCSEEVEAKASANHSVNLFQPSITFTKTADPMSLEMGGNVDYTITLTNTSSEDSPALNCVIIDEKLGIPTTSLVLSPGQSHTINKEIEFLNPEGCELKGEIFLCENTAHVDCLPEGFKNMLSEDASVVVELPPIAEPVSVIKSGPPYALVDHIVTYTVKITNNTTYTMKLTEINDSLVGVLTSKCPSELGAGESCTFTYEREISEDTVNTVTVNYEDGYGLSGSVDDDHSVDVLDPSFTVTKECTNEPIPQEGPAEFDVTFTNTGDVELIITADDGIGEFTLAAGDSITFKISIPGPFTDEIVENEVNASWTLPPRTELPDTGNGSASDSGTVGGRVEVLKMTNGMPNYPTQYWFFDVYEGKDGFGTTPIASDNTQGDIDGLLDFVVNSYPVNLTPDTWYTLCELNLPAGWTSVWTPGPPYNPNADDVPQQDLGNRCYDFQVGAGATMHFDINNKFEGGEPRTPGYWKNWNNCTNGNQYNIAMKNGGKDYGFFILEDFLPQTIGLLEIEDEEDCIIAVRVLSNCTVDECVNMASDPAYKLGRDLLGALFNHASSAKWCLAAQEAVDAAQQLLSHIGFTGKGEYLEPGEDHYGEANELANILDQYNNGMLCP